MSLSKTQELLERARAAAAEYRAKQAAAQEAAAARMTELNQRALAGMQQRQSSSLVSAAVSSVFTGADFQPAVPGMKYNAKQTEAVENIMRGRSICLVGAAGTGKTTTTKECILQLVKLPHIQPFNIGTKYLQKDAPGVVVISFTNKAVNNIKRQLPEALRRNCLTIHKLLEYMPVRDFTGKILGFAPSRNRLRPLPNISCIVWEESSMIGTDLEYEVKQALPAGCKPQEMYLGDLNQLPPVFGYSILGFKLLELPVVELDEVYRQAMNSPIISLAHRIRTGGGVPEDWKEENGDVARVTPDGTVRIIFWKKKVPEVAAVRTMGNHFCNLIEQGVYDPEQDQILCPFNVSFGNEEINRWISDHLGRKRNAEVFEILARGKYHYFAVGDRVMFQQQYARIVKIEPNPEYGGKLVRDPSTELDRWGKYRDQRERPADKKLTAEEALEIFESTHIPSSGTAKNAGSHLIKLEFEEEGQVVTLSAAGDINDLLFAYSITVHKSQGSEWRRVFIALHWKHNTMLSRELMYTAITRAREELIIFCEPGREGRMDQLKSAAVSPQIHGITLEQKANYFKGKKSEYTKPDFAELIAQGMAKMDDDEEEKA